MQNSNQPGESFRQFVPWLSALSLTALGAQFWIIWLYGSPVPIWDQWYEADGIFRSWLNGHLTLAELLAPDSNHRILVTRLFDMGLIQLNGRWDPMLQMTVNSFIRVGFFCVLASGLWDFLGRKNSWLICFLLLPFATLPYAGENAIWGINSLWYFSNLFGVVALVGLAFAKPGSTRWWCGVAASVIGLLNMATGLFAPLAAGGLILLRAIKSKRLQKTESLGLSVCVLFTIAGSLMIPKPDYNRTFQAHSLADFTYALAKNLSWPFMNETIMACIIALPLALLLAVYLRPNFGESRAAELLLGLAFWSALQSAAFSYGRANLFTPGLPSRYMDVFNIFVIASLFAAMLLGQLWERDKLPKWNGLLATFVFFGVICLGIWQTSRNVTDEVLSATREWNLIAEERIQTFMTTGYELDLFDRPTVMPDPRVTLRVLRDPQLQTILPPACFPTATAPAPGRFDAPARWLLRHGIVVLIGGFILFIGLCGHRLTRGAGSSAAQMPAEIAALLAGLLALGLVCSNYSVQRASVEYELQKDLVGFFKKVNRPTREAIHEHKAEQLKPK
jgi:hypothetical protein